MLYTCPCQILNEHNNQYRSLTKTLFLNSFFSIYNIDKITKVGIVFFEPGGLKDESDIIFYIIIRIGIQSTVYLYFLEENLLLPSIQEAHRLFQEKIALFKNIHIYFFTHTKDMKKALEKKTFDHLSFISIDPFNHLYFDFFKSEEESFFYSKKRSAFGLHVVLRATNHFYYIVELSLLTFNLISRPYGFHELLYRGNQNGILMKSESEKYFHQEYQE